MRHRVRAIVRRLRLLRQKLSLIVRPAVPWDGTHDPVVARFGAWRGVADGVHLHDFLGVKTHPEVRWGFEADPPGELVRDPPAPSQAYFELIEVLRAAVAAAGRSRPFVVAELGAGYGPWLVTAHAALRRLGSAAPVALIAVETEPQRIPWLRRHLEQNGIDPDAQRVLHGAVAGESGSVGFVPAAQPDVEYGTSVSRGRRAAGVSLPAYTLEQVFEGHATVDLLHVDIQGEEWRVLGGRGALLDERVGRLVVATHSRTIHRRMRGLLRRLGWRIERDFGVRSRCRTELGDVWFVDGMLAAVNPRVAGGAHDEAAG